MMPLDLWQVVALYLSLLTAARLLCAWADPKGCGWRRVRRAGLKARKR